MALVYFSPTMITGAASHVHARLKTSRLKDFLFMRSLIMVTGFCAFAGLTSQALADRGLSRTLEEGLERQTILTLETTRFDESFDVLD